MGLKGLSAARLARVEYEELPAILDVHAALGHDSLLMPSKCLRRGNPQQHLESAPHRLQGGLSLVMAMGGRVQPVHVEGDGVERHGRFRSSITVVPQPGGSIEPVPRQQLPALIRYEIHRIQNEGEDRLG